jgi:hypothetical protein
MGLGATLKKGLKYLLMSFGASSPPRKPSANSRGTGPGTRPGSPS